MKIDNISKSILDLLVGAKYGQEVGAISDKLAMSRNPISKRLKAMKQDGLVTCSNYQTRNVRWTITEAGELAAPKQGLIAEVARLTRENAKLRLDIENGTGSEHYERTTTPEQAREQLESCPVPTPDGYIIHPVFNKLARYLKGGVRSIWLTGEAGTGKTTAAEIISEGLGAELFLATPVQDKYELNGYMGSNDKLVETEVYRWATHDGPAVLLLDEVDGNLPAALLTLNSMLANWVGVFPNGKVRIADDKLVIATANTYGDGPNMKYTARQPLDAAFIDRFEMRLHWGIDTKTEMAVALGKTPNCESSVRASWKIRKNLETYGIDCEWGPRRTFALAKAVACGTPLREAAIDAGLVKLDEHDCNNALQGV